MNNNSNNKIKINAMCKPIDNVLVIKEEEIKDFLSRKKNSNKKLNDVFHKAQRIEGNIIYRE
ncbi:MAG: hypothetical protein IJ086_15920 [Clostridium sp.]|nr:hypothetical protein [Clostridium sp.]